MKGWERVDEVRPSMGVGMLLRDVFVAMWFDKSMNPVYEDGIRPAIVQAGYDPYELTTRTPVIESMTKSSGR
jgi:hypothetical protein